MGPSRRATVLIADRDRRLCRILEKALIGQGHRVFTAHDGPAALRAVRQHGPDLCILDLRLRLRGCDGLVVLEAIRALEAPASDGQIMLMSGAPFSRAERERADSLGAVALLEKPVSLRTLLEQVGQTLKPAAARMAIGQDVPAASPEPAVELEGTFRELAFPDLLHHLHGMRASGVLLLSSGKKRKAVQLRDGYPVAVSSNLVNECLGNLLMRRGALTGQELLESMQRVKKGEGLQGQILVAMELMTEEQVGAALREQAEEKLFEIFEWSEGRFKFQLGRRLPHGNELPLEAPTANLILDGVRKRLQLERVDDFIRSVGSHFVVHGEIPFYRFQDVELDRDAQRLLSTLGSGRRISDFATNPEAERRTLYGLIVTEIVDLRRDVPEAPQRPSVVRRRSSARREPAPPPPFVDAADVESTLREELAATAESFRGQSCFEILGVSERASDEEIERAYAERAPRSHPDRAKNASEAVRGLAEEVQSIVAGAYQTLRDPKRRREYQLEWRKGQREAAREQKDQRALEAEIEFQKGQAMLKRRLYEDALACFGGALQKNSSEGEYHAHYGWCLHLCHPDDVAIVQEAIEHVKRGVKLARDHEKPYLFLGRLCKVVGKSVVAEKMFTRAVQIRPDCVEALRELRLINLRRQKSKGLLRRLLRK